MFFDDFSSSFRFSAGRWTPFPISKFWKFWKFSGCSTGGENRLAWVVQVVFWFFCSSSTKKNRKNGHCTNKTKTQFEAFKNCPLSISQYNTRATYWYQWHFRCKRRCWREKCAKNVRPAQARSTRYNSTRTHRTTRDEPFEHEKTQFFFGAKKKIEEKKRTVDIRQQHVECHLIHNDDKSKYQQALCVTPDRTQWKKNARFF